MRVFVAGAAGALGRQLVPLLVKRGHEVAGLTSRAGNVERVRSLGAEAVLADAFDRGAVQEAVERFRPEVVVHEMTALSPQLDVLRFDREFALTNRLRTEGLDNLMLAAQLGGTRRFVAQSFCGWPYVRTGAVVKNETDALDPRPPKKMRSTLEAIRYLETAVLHAPPIQGVVLRYGGLYGPGTSITRGGGTIELLRRRRFPLFGPGRGVWSFVHVEDAARATAAAVESDAEGVFNIVDDEPAPVGVWLPALASLAGAPPPMHLPLWIARLLGSHVLALYDEVRGGLNVKAKDVLGWRPRYSSWRDGFGAELGGAGPTAAGEGARD